MKTKKATKITAAAIILSLRNYAQAREKAVNVLRSAIAAGWERDAIIKLAVKAGLWSKSRAYAVLLPLWQEAGNKKSNRGRKTKRNPAAVKVANYARKVGHGWKRAKSLLKAAERIAEKRVK